MTSTSAKKASKAPEAPKAPQVILLHVPQADEYGEAPMAKSSGQAPQWTVYCAVRGDYTPEQAPFGLVKASMPRDLPRVCPNMPMVAEVDGAIFLDCTKGDLAAWKATYTKRGKGGPLGYSLPKHTAAPAVDPAATDRAKRAWATRRAQQAEQAKG